MEEKQEELEIYQEEEEQEQDLPKKISQDECLQMKLKTAKKIHALLRNPRGIMLKLRLFRNKINEFKSIQLSSRKLQAYHKLIEEFNNIKTRFKPVDYKCEIKIKLIQDSISEFDRILEKNKFVLDEFIKTHAKELKNQSTQSRKRKRKNLKKGKKYNK